MNDKDLYKNGEGYADPTAGAALDELAKPGEIGYSRIYDRILERCLPVRVDGHSRRRQAAGGNWTQMRKQLGMEV